MARATTPKPIAAPELPAELGEWPLGPLSSELEIEGQRVQGGAFSKARVSSLLLHRVHVTSTAFDESRLSNLTWTDVRCERSTMPMIDWRGVAFSRVELRGCRLTGARFEGKLEDVRFIDCQLDYCSFAAVKCARVAFESCKLVDADFRGAELPGVEFADCDLSRADFTGSRLRGADIRRSNAAGITVGASELRGLVVNREQASALAVLLGLVVRD